MKRKVQYLFGILIILSVLIFVGQKIYTVNKKYPNPTIFEYSQEEIIDGGDINLSVLDSQLLPYEELKEICPEFQIHVSNADGSKLTSEQIKILILDVQVQNTSDIEKRMSFMQMIAQSGSWSNGFDLDLYLMLNNETSVFVNLEGKGEKNYRIPYIMYDFQFKEQQWKNITDRMYYFVLSVYPTRNQVLLDLEKKN